MEWYCGITTSILCMSSCIVYYSSPIAELLFRLKIASHIHLFTCCFTWINLCSQYVHYEVDQDDLNRIKRANMSAAISSLKSKEQSDFRMMPPQVRSASKNTCITHIEGNMHALIQNIVYYNFLLIYPICK